MTKGKNIFRGLTLDRDKLPGWIKEYAESKFETYDISEIEHIAATQHRCTINGDSKVVQIDFYYAENGKTTLRPTGKHHDISFELATSILGKLEYNITDNSRSYSVHPLNSDDFLTLTEYLEELEGVRKVFYDENEKNGYTLSQYIGKIGDKITLKYFQNKRLQIQGKPAFLYQEVAYFLSSFFPFDEVVKNQAEFYSVNIRPEEIRQEMEELLPSAYNNILGENLRKILAGSLALQKIDIDLDDYSTFVFPALKTLEGVIKEILLSNDVPYERVEKFGELFGWNATQRKYVYSNLDGAMINDGSVKSALGDLYTYYNKNRHRLFHVESIDAATSLVETKQQADQIIFKVLELIERACTDIMSTTSS
ncbi:type II toxin-antitoxin system RnlA family toxin [Priestia megaterium]